uniref:Putative terminase n=1 Tax=viral metagenome TaxID=1070528 RepID=A0A6M3IQU1_9ZZZZ
MTTETESPEVLVSAESFLGLTPERRMKLIESLTPKQHAALLYNWEFWARPKQLPPKEYYIWMMLSGRGAGKTRILSEMVRKWAGEGHTPIALVGQTKADVRDTMIEVGKSSILKISPPWFMPQYEPSKRRLTWPNGVQGIIYAGDEPDQLRGPQHAKAVIDELAKFQYGKDTFDNLMLGLRIGDNPQCVIATTPRPIQLLLDLIKDPSVKVTTGHTLENQANLPPGYINYVMGKYQGTKLGRQELAGEILSSNEGLVYDAFHQDTCIIPRFAIPLEWPRYFGMDFGRVNTAALWYAMEKDTGFLYCYRAYKKKASSVEHARNFRELSKGEVIRRRVGGNLQESNTRESYTQAGWPVLEPKISNDRLERIRRVNSLHSQSKIYYFSDLSDVIDEKLSFSYEVNKDDTLTEKIHNESAYHYMSAESYLVSEFQPDIGGVPGKEQVWLY